MTFKLKAKDFIDPQCLDTGQKYLNKKQIENLRFMRYLFYNPINASTFGPNTNSSRKNIAALGLGMGFDDTVKGHLTG